MKINKNKGILFRISGLPGSGKTRIAKKLLSPIKKKYGPTVMWSGDDLRRILNNREYAPEKRFHFGKKNINLIKFFNNQKMNVIFATVGLDKKIRSYIKKNITNYIEIFIKTNLKQLKKKKIRKFYNDKSKNVYGKDLRPDYPKKPHIKINNDFKKSLDQIKLDILRKLDKLL